ITVDWNIVETSHNITMDNASLPTANNLNRSVLGLFVTANELELSGDTATNAGNGLTVTHYLKIDGKIDLEGESQLIQTTDSDLDPTSSGSLERDQQGTRDLYTYNYWASPVGMINSTTNNNSYTLPNVFRDGTNPAAPTNINFITNGYNGSSGSPIGIADYWIWKYANQSGAYADWQHVRSTGSLLPGEGFTMKGVANTSGNVTLEQNYTYQGKPNNGDITLPITANNEYLVGNPYASAIDAHQFIMDNAPTIDAAGATTGTLYFWEHWGGGSHILAEYQGGYATYNLSGVTPAATYGTNDPMVATGGTPSKLPGRYIPVGQGFFVKSEATGTIRFTNAQRLFEKEGSSSSTFVRTANINESASAYNIDNRLKIRLGINTVNGIHRQLLVTKDSHATVGEDWGYDGVNNEDQVDDMYWMIEGNKYIIQGTDVIDVNTVLPIGIHTDDSGNNTFTIDALENVPDNLEIYIFDNATSTYHDIKANDFTINLPAGEYLDRFSMVFSTSSTLSIEDNVIAQDINTYYNNSQTSIIINNPKLHNITSVKLYNILSQEIFSETDIDTLDYTALKTGKLSTGTYIIKMKTDVGEISKKVLIE
ncbi:T9SS type A sorting domain-containing protein, partial [Mesoflavibacter zeaxanthinifaciens]